MPGGKSLLSSNPMLRNSGTHFAETLNVLSMVEIPSEQNFFHLDDLNLAKS